MATPDENLIASLMQMTLGRNQTVSQPWMSYGGIHRGPVTMLQQARNQVTNAAVGLLGPGWGNLLGGVAADYLVGRDFTKTGALQNRLSGLLAPAAGTYANAFQQMRQTQTLQMLTANRQQIQKDLKFDFFKNYYSMTMPTGTSAEGIEAQAKRALNNPLSIPSALQFILDPAQNQRALQGIKNTQAGYLHWRARTNPMQAAGLSGTPNAGKDFAEQLGKSMTKMAQGANAWMLGAGKGAGYGGFSGASVMQLASIMQNASDMLGQPGDVKTVIKNFQKKVQATTQALAPLKDIFGQDIKAMVDMIQSTTGQNINQLTPAMIRSIATGTVDMARYSGATVAQIAGANQKLFAQTAGYGGNSFTRIGGGLTGAYYTGLIAQGNAPAGIHAAEYAGSVARQVASGQASQGVNWTAMGYGLWKERNPNGTLQDFMKEVQEKRASTGTMMDAVMSVAGVKTQQGLLRGLGTTEYRTALQSGKLAMMAVPQQFRIKLADAVGALMGRGRIPQRALAQLGAFMGNAEYASAVKELATNANDPEAVKKFVTFARSKGYKDITEASVNSLINQTDILGYMTSYATTQQIKRYTAAQAEIRKKYDPLDKMGTGAMLSFWRGLSAPGAKLSAEGLKLANGSMLSLDAIRAQTRVVLGTQNIKQIQPRLKALQTTFGKQETEQLLGLASGEYAKDQEFMKSLRAVASGKAGKKQIGYIKALRAGYIAKNTKFTNETASKIYQEALNQFGSKEGKQEEFKAAVQKAIRLQNVQNLSQEQLGFGVGGKKKKETLAKLIKEDKLQKYSAMSQKQYNDKKLAEKTGLTYSQMKQGHRVTAVNYNRQVDFQRRMLTLLEKLLQWLQNNPKK